MKMEYMKFIDIIRFLHFPLRKVSTVFGLRAAKRLFPHYFNTEENLNFVGSIPDTSYYGIDEMRVVERVAFLVWYGSGRSVLFDKRNVVGTYCKDDVTLLRQACQVFRREFL